MITFKKTTFSRSNRPLVIDADLQLHPGWRIGLVGANGSGKPSLLALLRGEIHPDSGDLDIPKVWKIGSVSQETPALPTPALAFVLDGDLELRALEQAIEHSHDEDHPNALDGEAIAELHARYDELGGYTAKARAAEVLHGLGFSNADFDRAVADFSGGWRVRLNLARALSSRADLLLLDEPTNHLDLDAVLWLEGWLKTLSCTLILISHDRDFLDAVVHYTLAIEQQKLTLTTGGYSDYERYRAAQLAAQQSAHKAQQLKIAHLNSYIERFKAKATKARQAQSRLKALGRMELVAAAQVNSPFSFAFRPPESMPNPLLSLDEGAVGYGDEPPLLENLTMTIRPESRIGLLGPNGAGKSTLIKLLAGQRPLIRGERLAARTLKIGYFAQHQLEQLRPDESPLWHMMQLEPNTPEQAMRDYLGGFNFRGDDVNRKVAPFSGGEKSRLSLALLIRQRPNLLLLDEPTNHLDLEMREAINFALQDFEGGVILVSHDRHLLRTTAEEFWLVANRTATVFDGDLDDYAKWLSATKQIEKNQANTADKINGNAKNSSQAPVIMNAPTATKASPAAIVAQKKTLAKDIAKLESQLEKLNADKKLLDKQLENPALFTDPQQRTRAHALTQEHAALITAIESAEVLWLTKQDELNTLN